jgi:hypothetical protein
LVSLRLCSALTKSRTVFICQRTLSSRHKKVVM